ncbi:FecCD family ABC transporter permease [Aureibacter tunicatorum]|uniref:Iron complex transport system permease protein n=1 Tax=Aureibacter tunicatorum TaxID=866807 RepID=A0AAE4BRK2_9BACT|nr:iron ABC transporter permease [Aureibacter tunicatorum]MDR6238018.1 iron complex transport system permease protein [Aureibacter tunicatorum]BDD03051.1 hemin ABC transporter permease [Aureibacter tunicatorum]
MSEGGHDLVENVIVETKSYNRNAIVIIGLVVALVIVFFLSLTVGAVPIGALDAFWIILEKLGLGTDFGDYAHQQEVVLMYIRLPRIVLGVIVGGALAITGAAMQGLFRNPLVEPGLVGVSSGAALFAVVTIVFSSVFGDEIASFLGAYMLPVASFIGGLLVTILAYRLSQRSGKTDIAVLILCGVAINALAGSLIGLAIFYADDEALRSFTFWSMGDLSGADWKSIGFVFLLVIVPCVVILRHSSELNAIALGEMEAYHLGINVEKIKRILVVCSAMAVGSCVALTGMIGFIGLVVPHIIRLALGADHRLVLPASILGGAVLLPVADMLARTIVYPAELPLGIVTSLVGAPFFMYLLVKTKKRNGI